MPQTQRARKHAAVISVPASVRTIPRGGINTVASYLVSAAGIDIVELSDGLNVKLAHRTDEAFFHGPATFQVRFELRPGPEIPPERHEVAADEMLVVVNPEEGYDLDIFVTLLNEG